MIERGGRGEVEVRISGFPDTSCVQQMVFSKPFYYCNIFLFFVLTNHSYVDPCLIGMGVHRSYFHRRHSSFVPLGARRIMN